MIIPADFTQAVTSSQGQAALTLVQDPTLTVGPSVVKSMIGSLLDSTTGRLTAAQIAIQRQAAVDDASTQAILSQLLGGRTHDEERTELLLFVRPHIIKPNDTSRDANASIDQLTNKDQVKHYLDDPSKDKKENLLKQLTQ